MSSIAQLLRKLCIETESAPIISQLCEALKDRISYDACGAKYINEEGVFHLLRELSDFAPKEGLCTPKETKALLKQGGCSPKVVELLFPPIATLDTLKPTRSDTEALCEIPQALAQQLDIQADGTVNTSDLLKMASWYAKQ